MPGSTPATRKPLWIIIGGFSVALFANAALVYFALHSWTGLETQHPFAKGLVYNSNLEGAKRQQALGWKAELGINYAPGDNPSGTTKVRFTDKGGKTLDDLEVHILATRPSREGFDRDFSLALLGNGVYQGAFALPLKGQWDFRILARRAGDNYQRVERIITP